MPSTKWFELSRNIHIIGIDRANTTNVHPNRVLDEWVLVIVIKGQRTFSVYNESYAVHSDEFFLLPARTPHYGLNLDCHQAVYVHFQTNGKEVDRPTKIESDRILLPLYGQIPVDMQCISIFEFALQHRYPPFYSEPFIASQVIAVLFQLSIHMQKRTLWAKKDNIHADEIVRFIENNLHKKLCDRDYSDAFGKSYRQLNYVFKKVYGISIKQMQADLRIKRAKWMLGMGSSIAIISKECGFDDYQYFLKNFKLKTGFTPSEYIDRL